MCADVRIMHNSKTEKSVTNLKTIKDILMKFFVFGTTSRRADYINISNKSDQQRCQQDSIKLQILCPPYVKNGFSQLKIFLYSLLMFLSYARSEHPHIRSRTQMRHVHSQNGFREVQNGYFR
ncbi:hypothetical protein O3M35_012406 [Rhynocoris fuscipes]|uniref:Uncharacterized protein n=1 Tax=Rhynocoris fuscipes TaxID=488301 RepID=A0AAW1CYR2_9HEMI